MEEILWRQVRFCYVLTCCYSKTYSFSQNPAAYQIHQNDVLRGNMNIIVYRKKEWSGKEPQVRWNVWNSFSGVTWSKQMNKKKWRLFITISFFGLPLAIYCFMTNYLFSLCKSNKAVLLNTTLYSYKCQGWIASFLNVEPAEDIN